MGQTVQLPFRPPNGSMKKTCRQHCFFTLNHYLAYCYNDARVIKFVWTNLVKNRMKGGARSFDE